MKQTFSTYFGTGLRAFSLRQRLALGMAALILPLLLISFSGYLLFQFAIESMDESHEEIHDEMLPVFQLQALILQAQMPGNDYLILGDAAERDKFERLSADITAGFEKALAAPFGIREKRDVLVQARARWQDGERISREILALPDPVGNAAGAALMVRMDASMQSASDYLKAVSVLGLEELEQQHTLVHTLHRRVSAAIIAFLTILSVVVFIGSVLVRRWIIAPLSELENGAQQLTAGHLDHRIPVHSSDEIGNLARTFNDMATALKRDHDILRSLSIHDQLTGLLNRKEFQRLLDLEIARSLRHGRLLAVLMVDVDYFKSVNDRFGHPAGDVVLRTVADRLFTTLRPSDVVARYGGEEFIVLLPETDSSGAVAMAERLCAQMRSTPMYVAQDINPVVTVSIGIAIYPLDFDGVDDLIAAADQALYAAKQAGRDRCCRYADVPRAGG